MAPVTVVAEGDRLFTGKTHLPTPTKLIWYNNANLFNQAKWVYNLLVNVFPKIDMIVDQQVEFTASAEYSDVVLPANSWVEFQDLEIGGSCSNPFLQAWIDFLGVKSRRGYARAEVARSKGDRNE